MPSPTTVTINATPEAVTYLWCQFKRTRLVMKEALKAHDHVEVGYALGWFDALLDELVEWFPEELDPGESNPSQKP